jgi:hypothetical protein
MLSQSPVCHLRHLLRSRPTSTEQALALFAAALITSSANRNEAYIPNSRTIRGLTDVRYWPKADTPVSNSGGSFRGKANILT